MDNLINKSIVYYINLDERTDRNEHILNELLKIFPKNIINRFSAIKHEQGAVGCTMSHINILLQFINSNKEWCFIFEDDFEFLFPIDDIKIMLSNALKNEFNVIMMTYNGSLININFSTITNNIASITNGLTTAGYIVHKKFSKFLLNNFSNGLNELIKTENKQKYKIDVYWFMLQKIQNKFYAMMPCIGTQLSGYSTIELQNVDYIQCNTCIILTDFDLNINKSPFFCLKYNYINEDTIINIKNKYPKINCLFRITNNFFNKTNWKYIYDIYINMIKHKYSYKYFKISDINIESINNIEDINNVDYDNTFFMILN
jgi:hypothetical protein